MRSSYISILTISAALLACKSEPSKPGEKAATSATPSKAGAPSAEKAEKEGAAGGSSAALMDPSKADAEAPGEYAVKLETTKGDVIIDVDRSWAPKGADRFYNLVKAGYYNDIAFFRVIEGFMAQFGIHGDPEVAAVWRKAQIEDDPVKKSNTRGMVTFATGGPNTRTTQIFINYSDNSRLDGMGFAPFGEVRDMAPVDALYSGYGEGAPRGRGPSQGLIQQRGNEYLRESFPKLDYIKKATIIEP